MVRSYTFAATATYSRHTVLQKTTCKHGVQNRLEKRHAKSTCTNDMQSGAKIRHAEMPSNMAPTFDKQSEASQHSFLPSRRRSRFRSKCSSFAADFLAFAAVFAAAVAAFAARPLLPRHTPTSAADVAALTAVPLSTYSYIAAPPNSKNPLLPIPNICKTYNPNIS